MKTGLYIAIEGPDGAGKSSCAKHLFEYVGSLGHPVISVREPGGTKFGEEIRSMLLSREDVKFGGMAELCLFAAARVELIDQVISRAINEGNIVIADRCFLSTCVYQAYAPEKPLGLMFRQEMALTEEGARLDEMRLCRGLFNIILRNFRPDMIYILHTSEATCKARLLDRTKLDKIESRGPEFRKRVLDGYLAYGQIAMEPIEYVDAEPHFSDVFKDLETRVRSLLARHKLGEKT